MLGLFLSHFFWKVHAAHLFLYKSKRWYLSPMCMWSSDQEKYPQYWAPPAPLERRPRVLWIHANWGLYKGVKTLPITSRVAILNVHQIKARNRKPKSRSLQQACVLNDIICQVSSILWWWKQKEGLCCAEDITSSLAGMLLKYIVQGFHFNKQQLLVTALSLDNSWMKY